MEDVAPAEVIGLRDELERAFPRVMFGEPRSRAAEVEQQFSAGALITRLLGVLAALASLFGMVGLHAAIAQALTARTREIGVRIALGAPSRSVITATVGHHVPPAAIGIALGAGISIAGLAMLSTDDASMIRELALAAAMSPRWWIALIGLLLVTTLLSATVPVLRALRLSPADVLRRE